MTEFSDLPDYREKAVHQTYQEQYYINAPYACSSYEVSDDKIIIHDAIWGRHEIGGEAGDEVFLDLIKNPLVTRLQGIEQLTLAAAHTTIPGTAEFSRWESQWGSVAFVRKMTEGMDLDPREKIILQLRTFLSDVGHTAFSHMGDWLFQGFGSDEDQHDTELMDLLEVGGVNDILRKHAIEPSEVVFPEVEDWIENASPELCVDRVDYGAREIRRWVNVSTGIWEATKPQAFSVNQDGQLVMSSFEQARDFALAFALLPTEHWGQPVHRLQLTLLQESLKRMLIHNERLLLSSTMHRPFIAHHPREYLYAIDSDFMDSFALVDELLWLIGPIMKGIGLEQRRIFSQVRSMELERFFVKAQLGSKPSFPHPLESYSWRSKMHPLTPSNITIEQVASDTQQPPVTLEKNGLRFYLHSLKARSVDPLFIDDHGKTRRLSEASRTMKKLLKEQKAIASLAYAATLHLSDEYARQIYETLLENEQRWPEALQRPHMDKEQLVRIIGDAALYAPKKGLTRVHTKH